MILPLFSLISPAFADEATSNEPKKFIVTAYYSPLPNQSFYLKGSYEADIRLNGNGTHGASGKEVYVGMLAGPKSYAFGTKVYLEGLGVGTVDDRGGAIVASGSRGYDADRLDIWMWQGEEGLRRALSWGKRRVTGKILEKDAEGETIDLSQVKITKISAAAYKKQQEQEDSDVAEVVSIFSMSIGKNTDPEKIKELQIILSRLSYYHGDIDGKYSKAIEDAIYDFQIENQLIVSKKNYWAGFYGAKTRAKLKEIYALYTENEKKRVAEEARVAMEKAKEEARLALIKIEQEKQKEARKTEVTLFVQGLGSPKADEVGAHVRSLQQSLKTLGYFAGKDTAIFGKNTRAALTQYQTDRKVTSDEFGKLGKATKIALFKDLLSIKEKQNDGLAFNN
jgi:peptidoglycan hydrolase-like protein with peptidoglycan-binding domain/3D (Asp-Asp-Asp) domain-containing protein